MEYFFYIFRQYSLSPEIMLARARLLQSKFGYNHIIQPSLLRKYISLYELSV